MPIDWDRKNELVQAVWERVYDCRREGRDALAQCNAEMKLRTAIDRLVAPLLAEGDRLRAVADFVRGALHAYVLLTETDGESVFRGDLAWTLKKILDSARGGPLDDGRRAETARSAP